MSAQLPGGCAQASSREAVGSCAQPGWTLPCRLLPGLRAVSPVLALLVMNKNNPSRFPYILAPHVVCRTLALGKFGKGFRKKASPGEDSPQAHACECAVFFPLCVDITHRLAHYLCVVLKREPHGSAGASAGRVCGGLFVSFSLLQG